MAPQGPGFPASSPSLSLSAFYCPLLSFPSTRPTLVQVPKTITFFKLLLDFPDLLPQARKVTLSAGLVRAWLGPQTCMAREGEILPQRPMAAQ